jgi:hypothetical protein
MCTTDDEIDIGTDPRPAGRFGRTMGWIRDRVRRAEDEALNDLARAESVARGKRLCRRCGEALGDEPGETCGLLDRRLCYSCDVTWLEDKVLWPLVDRLHRKGARKALRRLVRRVKELV